MKPEAIPDSLTLIYAFAVGTSGQKAFDTFLSFLAGKECHVKLPSDNALWKKVHIFSYKK